MNLSEKTPRRIFFRASITSAIAMSAGLSLTASIFQSFTADAAPAVSNDADFQQAATEKEFRMGIIGPAEFSLASSQIAVEMATNKNAKEFAGFELAETLAITGILKDMGTPVPAMTTKVKMMLAKIKAASQGTEFDKVYIGAQLENHNFLRNLAENYLKSAADKTSAAERQGRHLATLALATFKEHLAITRRILTELGG